MSLLDSDNRAALFPLNTVLFPGCTLALKIIEQRYLRLIKSCLRDHHGFVVILICAGREVGDTPEIYRIGSYVEIIDWTTLDGGLFGITIEAKYRVRVSNPCAQDDGLLTGEIEEFPLTEPLEQDPCKQMPDLIDILKQLEQHPYSEKLTGEIDFTSAKDICYKLSQLLPVDPLAKQGLLEVDSTAAATLRLRELIRQLAQ